MTTRTSQDNSNETDSTTARIAVIGAGIGGLSLAQGLVADGHDVTVWERAPELRAEGAGITMQINAMIALDAIGVGDAVRAAGAPIEHGALRDARGEVLQELDLTPLSETLGTAGYGIHRADLLTALADGLEERMEFDRGLTGLTCDDEGCALKFSDGTSAMVDIVVGADGIHSTTRGALYGDEPLRYAGYTTWRGVTEETPEDREVIGEFWGGELRFGAVPIGKDKLYWFAVAVTAPEGRDGADVSAELLELFADWPENVRDVLGRTKSSEILRTDTYDRPPSRRWGSGRVTLLGDAAHPMTPNLGQGGGQAVEDAAVLAHFISVLGPRPEALRAYEAKRIPRANGFVSRSYSFGRMAHLESQIGRAARNLLMRWAPESITRRQLASLYRFEMPR